MVAYVLCITKNTDLKVDNNFIKRKRKVSVPTRNFDTISTFIA